jgi:fibronectin type 3 domain-containing protein
MTTQSLTHWLGVEILLNRESRLNDGMANLLVFLLMSFLAVASCSTYTPTPIQPETQGSLPAPDKLVVKVGNGFIELTWTYDDSSLVKEYRIYRKNQDESTFRQIASTKPRKYRDDRLTNGVSYQYEIAAVSKSGAEGEHSKTIAAIPAIYSIVLSGGAKYINRQNVPITITAPQNTTLMMLANDSLFANANWEPFASTRTWELTFGDGVKSVYAKFRNNDDQETAKPVKAEIILDTSALIKFIDENSQGKILKAGDKLHIRLSAGETKGNATADIVDASDGSNGRELNIRLYDDGTNDDRTRDDGIYEADYTVRTGLEVLNAYVYGHFTDAAGNVAPAATSPGRVTIQLPPSPVILHEPTTIVGSPTSLSLRWTRNTDNDFLSYQLRRSRDPVVSLSSTLVKEFNDSQTISYIDSGLEPGTKYYYRIYVFDTAGNNSGSNITQATTPANEAPKPVVLSQPVPDGDALTLTWSPSVENDFANYRLYRSTSAPVDTASAPIVVINNAQTTQYRDLSVQANVTYYYRLFVFDKYGLSAGSNQVQGRLVR